MAIIECNECGNDVSEMADACPKCGFPINKTSLANKTEDQKQRPVTVQTRAQAEAYKEAYETAFVWVTIIYILISAGIANALFHSAFLSIVAGFAGAGVAMLNKRVREDTIRYIKYKAKAAMYIGIVLGIIFLIMLLFSL